MAWVSCSHDGGVTSGMRERESKNQLRGRHLGLAQFVQTGTLPNLIDRFALNFRLRPSLADSPANDHPGTPLCDPTQQCVMLWFEARVEYLVTFKNTQSDHPFQLRQGARHTEVSNASLLTKRFQQLNQSVAKQII